MRAIGSRTEMIATPKTAESSPKKIQIPRAGTTNNMIGSKRQVAAVDEVPLEDEPVSGQLVAEEEDWSCFFVGAMFGTQFQDVFGSAVWASPEWAHTQLDNAGMCMYVHVHVCVCVCVCVCGVE
jgi:hypothetical protein